MRATDQSFGAAGSRALWLRLPDRERLTLEGPAHAIHRELAAISPEPGRDPVVGQHVLDTGERQEACGAGWVTVDRDDVVGLRLHRRQYRDERGGTGCIARRPLDGVGQCRVLVSQPLTTELGSLGSRSRSALSLPLPQSMA